MSGTLVILLALLLFEIPMGVINFVFLHKTYGVRKVLVLVFNILFFVFYGLGIIFISSDFEDLSLGFMATSFPFGIASFVLVLTRPGNFSPKQPNLAKQNLAYIEELERLKKLLDCGAITKEEYDAKKSEILNRK